MKITHRWTEAVLFENDAPTMRATVEAAVKVDADLSGAVLSGADLSGAVLSGADLSGADLSGADLSDADLSGAVLSGADLSDADLSGADLSGADLSGADLSDADLSGAVLSGADLSGAVGLGDDARAAALTAAAQPAPERPAELTARRAQDRAARSERYRQRHPDVPVVPHLDARILAAIGPEGEHLEMSAWHGNCGTTHCRAGWAITLAGEAGRELERRYDSHQAGMMIYLASTGRGAYFYATNERALADIRERAAADPLPSAEVSP